MTAFVLPLDSPGATLNAAGGKAANLSALVRAGFPVPPGFVLTTAAYRAVVDANTLQARIEALAGALPPDDPAAAEAASRAIRALFDSAGLPDDLAAAIRTAYQTLAQVGASHGPGRDEATNGTARDMTGGIL